MEVVTPTQPTQRQVNIELLRVIAMFMVVVLHCNAFGENMRNTEPLTLNWLGIWFLEKISIVAVNCYVLISGYFLITSEFKYRKLFSIWFQVLFYSICIYFVMGIIYGWGSMFTLMHSFLPVSTKSYWFATTYLALYAISPFLNIAIRSMAKIQMQGCILVLVIIFSLWPSLLPFVSSLDGSNGYGIIWFVLLYLIAAYIRLHQPQKSINRKYPLLIYFAIVLLSMLCLIVEQKVSFPWTAAFQRYNGIGVLIASLSVFVYFLGIDFKQARVNKIIVGMSGLTFGVYLIHENFLVREHLYTDWLNMPSYVNTQYQVLYIITCTLGIYIISSLIEYLRQKLFLILRIDILMQKLDTCITKHISRFKAYL